MNKTADRTVALDKGRVDVYTKNGVTLYAYCGETGYLRNAG